MKARLDRKTKILTAAVLCACTTLWANPVWAQKIQDSVLYGGNGPEYLTNVNSNGNEVVMDSTVNSGEVKGIYGGFSVNPDGWGVELEAGLNANGNTVTVNGGKIIGGSTELKAYPIGSGAVKVFSFDTAVVGGYANYTLNNTVIINDGDIATDIYGGFMQVSNNKNVEIIGNNVYINGGNITGENIAGVYINDKGKDNNNVVRDNGVYITYGIINAQNDNSNIYGAYVNDKDSKLENNKVVISGGEINASDDSRQYAFGIYGACADRSGSSASYNSVEISGGTINGAVYGAYAYANSSDELIQNKVVITGGKITGDIYAVYSRNGAGTVKDNGIEISGNAILENAELHGFDTEQRSDNQSGQYLLADNYQGSIKSIDKFDTVNILNGSNVTVDSVDLYSYDYSDTAKNGNLTVNKSKFKVGGLGYVDELSIQDGSLEADDIYVTDKVNVINSFADIKALGDGVGDISVINSDLTVGRLYNFDNLIIDNDNDKNKIIELGDIDGSSYFDNNTYTQRGPASISTDSSFKANSIVGLKELDVDMTAISWEKDTAVIDVSGTTDFTGTAISATGTLAAAAGTEVQNGDAMSFIKAGTLTGAKAEDINIDNLQIGFATEAQVEVQDGSNSIDFVVTGGKQATEQVSIIGESRTAAIAFVNQGSDILNNAFGLMDDGKYGIKTFAAAHGNYSKYETGSHIRVNGWSMLAGVGSSEKVNDGAFSWGVFFENGSGNYRTYNDYNGFNLEGFGSAVYNGGGALARYRSNAGNYAEVGVRAGMLKNSLSNAVADGFGVQGGYDEETSYYGAHVGAGHIFTLDDHSSLDVYGKYFYTHHDSDEFEILGDEVRFDSADSSHLRLGMRYNQNDGNAFSHYYGLAWDYEFNGDADVTAAGFDTGNPSLKGSTAVIEAGIHYAPDKSPWSVDFGLQGYGGQRDGFSGTMQVNYSF